MCFIVFKNRECTALEETIQIIERVRVLQLCEAACTTKFVLFDYIDMQN